MFIFRWLFKTLSKILLLLGVVLLISGFISSKMLDSFYEKAIMSEATIVYFDDDRWLSEDPNVFVQYTVDGKGYTEKLGDYEPDMEVGGKVMIYYNPDIPKNIRYSGAQRPEILMYTLGAVLFVLGAIIGIVRSSIQRRREERAAERRVEKKNG